MNNELYLFYCGIERNVDGKSFKDLLKLTDIELEQSHTVIQWLFPLFEQSLHSYSAPLLNDETIQKLKESYDCRNNLILAGKKLYAFLIQNNSKHPSWVKKNNHNYLRITRIIKFCRLMGNENLARSFYDLGLKYYNHFPKEIGEKTLKFWQDAMNG